LTREGSKDDGKRFFVKDQSDRAPALSDPKPDPCEGEDTDKREEKFRTGHRLN
jgi:hypothetical protein